MEKNNVRITLRISEDLHEKLTESAEQGTRSLNSEIAKRLEESYCVELSSDAYLTVAQAQTLIEGRAREMIVEAINGLADHFDNDYFGTVDTSKIREYAMDFEKR